MKQMTTREKKMSRRSFLKTTVVAALGTRLSMSVPCALAIDKQQLCDKFYEIGNIVTIRIAMPNDDWEKLRNAEPHGGRCNFAYTGDRYDWYKTTYMDISGSEFPSAGPYRYYDVGIKKRSYCGSFRTTKPDLKLHFSKYKPSNEDAIESLIGTQYIALNNSLQDKSYLRQTLGYALFRQAGLPFSRCNYSHVYVNGKDLGIFVNVEPIEKRHIKNNFADNDQGNLYEIEVGEDFDPNTLATKRLAFQGFSNYHDERDFELAVKEIQTNGIAGMEKVINVAQYLRFLAMEMLLKHWDGYNDNQNNTYIYNDMSAVATPTVENVDFKFIPWGIDQILQPTHKFHFYDKSILGKNVLTSPLMSRLKTEIRNRAITIFDRKNYESSLGPLISQMEGILTHEGLTEIFSYTKEVRQQVRLVKGEAFEFLGEIPTDFVWLHLLKLVCREPATSFGDDIEIFVMDQAAGGQFGIDEGESRDLRQYRFPMALAVRVDFKEDSDPAGTAIIDAQVLDRGMQSVRVKIKDDGVYDLYYEVIR